jgi:hypothetical protein
MKNLIYIILILSVSICLFGQEKESQDLSQNKIENEKEERIKLWKEDSKLIMSIISELREYRADNNDTEIQSKYKKEQLKKKLYEANIKYKGKEIKLNKVMVEDVEEKNGRFIAIYLIPLPKNDTSLNGVIIKENLVDNSVDNLVSSDVVQIKIIRLLNNISEALNIKKNEIIILKGIIKSINYNGSAYFEKAEIIFE